MLQNFLTTTIKQFQYYKLLGDKTFEQLTAEQICQQLDPAGNSIAVIVKHLHGNMLSRWTDFLTTDGEKEWRDRESEFEIIVADKQTILDKWEEAWACLFHALQELSTEDLDKIIYIRNQGHTVSEAILRQLAHYPYHVGQIVYIGKMIKSDDWVSLSIAKGESKKYNEVKFAAPKTLKHFTDEYLNEKMNKG